MSQFTADFLTAFGVLFALTALLWWYVELVEREIAERDEREGARQHGGGGSLGASVSTQGWAATTQRGRHDKTTQHSDGPNRRNRHIA